MKTLEVFFRNNLDKLDLKALIAFHQHEFMITMNGEVNAGEYFETLIHMIHQHPKEFIHLLGYFAFNVLTKSPEELAKRIRKIVFATLKDVLLHWSPNDSTVLDFCYIYAPADQRKEVYNWLFKIESYKTLRESFSVTTIKTWAGRFLFEPALEEEQKQELWAWVKRTSMKAYHDLQGTLEVDKMDKKALRQFFEVCCSTPIKEQKVWYHLNKRKAWMKHVDKLDFEDGYENEFFKRLPTYLANNDYYNCVHFMALFPQGEPKKHIDELKNMLQKFTFLPDEASIVKSKIAELQWMEVLKKANS